MAAFESKRNARATTTRQITAQRETPMTNPKLEVLTAQNSQLSVGPVLSQLRVSVERLSKALHPDSGKAEVAALGLPYL